MSQSVSPLVGNTKTDQQVSIERLRIYWDSVGRVIQVCEEAEREEQEWSRARCNGILTDCRKRFCRGLKRLGQSPLTEWEHGFSYVLDELWHTINPVRTGDRTELFYRIKKAKKVAAALEALLAALMSVEPSDSMMLTASCMEPEPEIRACREREASRFQEPTEKVMTVKVHLTAYGERDEIRRVQIPTEELVKTGLLNLVYHYGQNEAQPQDHPSVSVGDVVELDTRELFICGFSDDWQPISRETFEAYQDQAYCGSEAASIWVYPSRDKPEASTTEASEPVNSEISDEPKPESKQERPKGKLSDQAADLCWQWLKLTKWGRLIDS